LKVPTNVLLLFNKVSSPPRSNPEETAVWHFGWHVTDIRKKLEFFKGQSDVKALPQYAYDDTTVIINSDTYGGTKADIDAAIAKGVKPKGGAGVFYIAGPDNALIELAGNNPVERINHVHMYQEEPFCAVLWYQKHLNAPLPGGKSPSRTEADCKEARSDKSFPALFKGGLRRAQNAGVVFDDVAMNWNFNQLEKPLVSTRGYVVDHFALSVTGLDGWAARLRAGGVKFLEEPHRLGDTRALTIEGPSREQIELVESN
jgi:hypothetical protein